MKIKREKNLTIVTKPQNKLVDRPFPKEKLFKSIKNHKTRILVDVNSLLNAILDDYWRMRNNYGLNCYPFLLEIFNMIRVKIEEVGFEHVIFFVDSDFYIYLLPDLEKRRKIKDYANNAKYLIYQTTKDEYECFEQNVKRNIFVKANKKRSYETQLLYQVVINEYRLLSNNLFDHEYYNFIQDYILNNRFTFEIHHSIIRIFNETGEKVGEVNLLFNVLNELKEKVLQILRDNNELSHSTIDEIYHIRDDDQKIDIKEKTKNPVRSNSRVKHTDQVERIKSEILENVAINPTKYKDLRDGIRCKNKDFQIAFSELKEEEKIEKIKGAYWQSKNLNQGT